MKIVARPPVRGTGPYLLKAMRPKLNWLRVVPGSKPLPEDTLGPTVVLIGDDGREVVLQRPGTFGQAKRAAARLEAELERKGPAAFEQRYGLHL